MEISIDKIVSSGMFQFLVGPDRKAFSIHTALATHHSAPLAALINGSMREAKDRIAILEDIHEQTFVRFCEFAYMGDYLPAPALRFDMEKPPPSSEESIPVQYDIAPAPLRSDWGRSSPPVEQDPWAITGKKKKGVAKKNVAAISGFYDFDDVKSCGSCGHGLSAAPKQVLWEAFQSRDYSVVNPKPGAHQKGEECEDNADPFIYHARVYVFADRYDIAKLRVLALDKLHRTLCSLKVSGTQMGKVIDLIRFSYSNDNTPDNKAGQDIDSLRRMAVHFVACVFEDLVKENNFLELMEEGGPFARDLMTLLVERIK